MTMVPTIARIIHVYESLTGECLAAIVTSVDYQPELTFTCTVFASNGAHQEAARRIAHPSAWHDPRECPQLLANTV